MNKLIGILVLLGCLTNSILCFTIGHDNLSGILFLVMTIVWFKVLWTLYRTVYKESEEPYDEDYETPADYRERTGKVCMNKVD